ncbi:MAG TPA: XdhC family protein [Mizugakiibacter sp.]
MNEVREPAAIAAPHGGLRAVLDALAARHARGETPVLAVVTACSGPTYRKPGALALFDETGLVAGALSGGCLEEELAIAAREALATARAVAHGVDTGSADDLVFGTGSGCGGRMDVLLLPLLPQVPLAAALHALRSGASPLAVTLHADGSGAAQLGEGETWQWPAPAGSAASADASAPARLAITPPPRLLALGAGPETPALLQFLQRLGWYVEVQEHRARWASYAAGADALHAAPPGTLPEVAVHCRAAVVMTHQFEGDRAHLAALAATSMPYVGLLGPTARRDALLAALGDAAAALRPRLHAPVGLRLGGEGPEAIALSIAAGLTAHLHGRDDG